MKFRSFFFFKEILKGERIKTKDRNFLTMIEIQEKIFRRIFMIESNNQSRIINLYHSAFERKDSEFVKDNRKRMINFFFSDRIARVE